MACRWQTSPVKQCAQNVLCCDRGQACKNAMPKLAGPGLGPAFHLPGTLPQRWHTYAPSSAFMLSPRVTAELGSKSTSRTLLQSLSRRVCHPSRSSGASSPVTAMASREEGPARQLSVAVIGAGAAGLVAARELLREGHRVSVFEKSPIVGGVWVYTDEVEDDPLGVAPGRHQVHGSMYANLRTNLPREVMGFSDFPFDANFPGSQDSRQFCSHEEVLKYLEAFALWYDLVKVVQTKTEVVAVRPLEGGSDPPTTSGSASAAASAADLEEAHWGGAGGNGAAPQPAAANGSSSSRQGNCTARWEVTVRKADGPGDGRSEAAASQPSPAGRPNGNTDHNGKSEGRGAAGNLELFDAVVICNGHYAEPRVPPFPGQAVFPGLQMHSHNYRKPEPFAGQTVLLVGAASSGVDIAQELARAGARVYLCARVWENPLTGEALDLDTSSAQAAKPGKVAKAANIRELHADGSVTLESGTVVPHVDTVMYCTGYYYSFPFLEGTGIINVEDNRVAPLYRHVFPPTHAPYLSFVGLPWKVVPFPQMELQSRWIARALSGRAELPSAEEMDAEAKRFYAELEAQGVAPRYTHRQAGELQWQYNDFLADSCGADIPRQPAWRKALYNACGNSRKLHGDAYRDEPLPGVAEEEQEARREAEALWAAAEAQRAKQPA